MASHEMHVDGAAAADERRQRGIDAAAAALREAWASGGTCAPVRSLLPEGDVDAAYAVQDTGTRDRLDSGRRIVGRKIGLTSPAVQKQLGVNEPDYGILFDDMDVPLGSVITWGRVHQPKVEAEVAFIMDRDLNDHRLTTADVLASVRYVVAAIEIVGSRIANWDIRLVDTVADNASAGLFALGHQVRRLSECDLVATKMSMTRRNEVVSSGNGAACLGSPISAVLWLAKVMAHRGRPLRAGDVVLSGALGPMIPAVPGDSFDARIESLGSVQVVFGEAR